MGGLLPSWKNFYSGGIAKPSDVAKHWDEAGRHYQMPIDGDIWLEDPLDSSYPPSVAFIAAKMQDKMKAEKFLRRIKEMVFVEKKNIAKWEHLYKAALGTGLDMEKFKQDLEGEANALFQADLDLVRAKGVRGFPTLFFVNEKGEEQVLYGVKAYEYFEQAILELHPDVKKNTCALSSEEIFSHYPTVTTKEFSVITDRSMEISEEILQGLADRNIVEKILGKSGEFWKFRS
jgi:predicted DsbA family dithiol-disulfide isomerase